MRVPIEIERKIERKKMAAYVVNHLPIIKEYAIKLGLIETINTLIPCKMDVEPGVIFLGMILDTLSGRTPLYRLDEFFENQDTELLLGKNISPSYFSDYNVGRILDKAYEIGSIKIFTAIANNAVSIFDVNTKHVSFDTTSRSVFGDYDNYSVNSINPPFIITQGHSKDHRPDLKQFLISMLCVDRSIPIFGKTEDGNGSDKTINNNILSSISSSMAKQGLESGAFIYIADSAVVTKKNLEAIGDNIQIISRLPASYKECNRVIKKAIEKDAWNNLGVLSFTKETVKRSAARYKSYESNVTLHGKKYRAVVIHSSAHDKRRQKRLDRELAEERKRLDVQSKKITKKEYYCQADTCEAVKELKKSDGKYYRLDIEVKESPKYRPGRPKDGVIREVSKMMYKLIPTTSAK